MNPDSSHFNIASEITYTAIVVVAVLLINLAISTILRKRTRLSRETKLRASVFWRNFMLLAGVIVLIFIWRTEIRAAALSVAALSVAMVIAGKELLTSVLGYIYRTTTRSFEFGDVLEINDVKGEVIDQTLLSTTVLEMNEDNLFTGKVVQFPNSFFITHPMKNNSRLGNYQLALTVIPLASGANVDLEKRLLLEVANDVCADHIVPTQKALRELEGEQFIIMPSAEPRVTTSLTAAGTFNLTLRYPCLAEQRTNTEQAILHRYLAESRKDASN